MASPRPGTSSNSNRPLAYKSPAVKTPASAQGHTHHVSVSSQPSSTPLPATAIHDDLLALNSPATALINSLGQTALTPLGNSGEGLGISTNLQGGRSAAGSFNPEVERLHRVQLVADTLKSRVAGHGITREGVERIAQLEGFTTLWDDDNLTIAGNTVDLEVNFDAVDRDHVKDVSLKLNTSVSTSESDEPQFQEQGTEILKNNLKAATLVDGVSQWNTLDAFASNLRYLSQLDRIEGGAPCFDAVKDLYTSFQKIWNAEKDRLKGRPLRQHLKRSAVGRASMDRAPKLGLALDYWTVRPASDQISGSDVDGPDNPADFYTARISCEPGAPSTVLTKEWVADVPLVEDSHASPDTAENFKPDWTDPAHDAGGAASALKHDPDDPTLDKPMETPNVLDMHFSCTLLPEVYLPLNVAANLNVELPMVEMNQELAVTYQTALQEHFNMVTAGESHKVSAERWLRSLPTTDEGNPHRLRQHSYALHSAQHAAPLWCYPLKHLKFIHPKQLAAVLPALRQYALVWSILRSLVDYGVPEQKSEPMFTEADKRQTPRAKARQVKRTNAKTLGPRLDGFLNANGTTDPELVLPIDLTLDVISDMSKARLDIFVPLHGLIAKGKQSPFIFLSLEICPGGVIEIKDLGGVSADADDTSKLRSKVVQILISTEDIGLVVEWLLEQAGPA